jgi:diamine N-acetyltransferase
MKDRVNQEKTLLVGDNIRLRAVEPEDVERILAFENDPEIWTVSNTLMPYSRFEIEAYVLNAQRDIYAAKQLRLMIDLGKPSLDSPTTIGTIDLFDFDPLNLRTGIGIMITKAFRHHGYAKEAIEVLLDYCRKTLRLHQVYCHIAETNKTSIHLFESLGFVLCGTRKEWFNSGDQWVDEIMFQYIFQ